jgi:hypothetical protein
MDKLAMYKEEIYKVAFSGEEKAEKKVLLKELNKSVETKNTTNKKNLAFHEYSQPNNFKGGSKVKTALGVEFIPDKHDVSYRTTSTGEGLKTPYIFAHKFHGDVLKDHIKDETEKQYKERKKENVKKSIKTRKRWIGAGLGTLGAATAGGAAIGTKVMPYSKGAGAVVGGLYGSTIGLGPAAMVMIHGMSKSQKDYVKRLKPHELEQLLKLKHEDAKNISQDAHKADFVQEITY